MARFFLSYSSAERVLVTRVAVELLLRGFSVWLDKWESSFGEAIRPRIAGEIGNSDFLLLFLSPTAVASAWVRKELAIALRREQALGRTFVIPVLVASCQVPAPLVDRIYADFSQAAYLEQLEVLIRYLRRLEPGEGNQSLGRHAMRGAIGRRVDLLVSPHVRLQPHWDARRSDDCTFMNFPG